jgi:hypothetical protein
MKKIALLCLALVLALGALGVGYASWTDTIFVTGTVDTGTVLLGFSKTMCSEQPEFEGKDWVASIDCYLTGDMLCQIDYAGVPRQAYREAEFVLTNAYPCWQTAVVVDVCSCGTIPVKITELTITMEQVDCQDPETVIETLTWVGTTGQSGYFNNAAGETVFSIDVVNLVGTQLHEGDKDAVEFDMHVKQPMEQNACYIITISITGEQWNEA